MATLYGSFARIDLADGVLVAMADDTTVRVCAAPSPDVERLTADVARLERANADLRRLALGDLLTLPADLARDVLIGALSHLDASGDVSARDTIDSLAIDLGEALSDLRRDLRDGREDDHADHAAAFRRLAALALRGAAAADRRAAGGSR